MEIEQALMSSLPPEVFFWQTDGRQELEKYSFPIIACYYAIKMNMIFVIIWLKQLVLVYLLAHRKKKTRFTSAFKRILAKIQEKIWS